jgi:hypothetical protein
VFLKQRSWSRARSIKENGKATKEEEKMEQGPEASL